jgi:AcrR family transcriptional regulator
MSAGKAVHDGDAALVRGKPLPSARVPLNRERVVQTALVYLEENGVASLSMRRLAQVLGVEAMSLYRHVPGKEDLLDAVVARLVAELDDDPQVVRTPDDGWQDFLQRLAHGIRRVALGHPHAFPLVASRPPEAPWLRPPLRSLEWVELFLDGMIAEGFAPSVAVSAYRSFSSFLLGHLLLEVASLGADVGPLDVLDDGSPDYGGLEDFPRVGSLRAKLGEDHSAAEFEEALEALLERLGLLLKESDDSP